MGKQYLNRQEKQDVITIACFQVFMDDIADKWEELGRDKGQIADARRARSFAQRVLDSIFEELDQDEVTTVMKSIEQQELVLDYKAAARRKRNRKEEIESVTPVETEDLLTIVDYALSKCINECKETDQEKIKSCPRRKVFLKYDIQPLHLDPPEGKCPYQYYEGV